MAQPALPNRSATEAAALAIAAAIGGERLYAVVGGAACLLLGGMRLTEDVDIVVPRNCIPEYRKLFKTPAAAALGFTSGTEDRKPATFHGPEHILIELLSPPGMFRGPFDENTQTVTVNGVRVLHPLNLLDAKCQSVLSRGDHKRYTDSADIAFLLDYCTENELKITSDRVPHANPERIEYLISEGLVAREVWERAGYVQGKGWNE